MPESAFERAVSHAASGAGGWLRRHDRFVVIGLLFSLLPLPPACFAGVAIGLVNLLLLRRGRLSGTEGPLVRLALTLGVLNTAVVVLILVWFAHHLRGMAPTVGLPYLPHVFNELLNALSHYFDWIYGGQPDHGIPA